MQGRNGRPHSGRTQGGGDQGGDPGFPESGLFDDGADDAHDEAPGGLSPGDSDAPPGGDSIRERQRRRRNAGRARPDLAAILAQPDDAADEDDAAGEDEAPSGPPPPRVFVVFRGAEWQDPTGDLRESDTIVGVYATEEAARRAVAAIKPQAGVESESWYQPYPVQS